MPLGLLLQIILMPLPFSPWIPPQPYNHLSTPRWPSLPPDWPMSLSCHPNHSESSNGSCSSGDSSPAHPLAPGLPATYATAMHPDPAPTGPCSCLASSCPTPTPPPQLPFSCRAWKGLYLDAQGQHSLQGSQEQAGRENILTGISVTLRLIKASRQ